MKTFSQTDHQENDPACREAFTKWFRNRKPWFLVKDNEDIYGPDLVLTDTRRNEISYVEVERKKVWTSFDFPFQDLHIPGRKAKFKSFGKVSFVVMSNNLQQMFAVSQDELTNDRLMPVKNIYSPEGEMMFCIPLEKCHHYWLID